jgi:putative transposase
MIETTRQIADLRRYFGDARGDYYHKKASELLRKYDVVGIGDYRIGTGSFQKAKHDHAISQFVSICEDKARLSLTPRFVYGSVNEAYTTQRCNICKNLTGPKNDCSVREWTCSICGTNHLRDVNAAKEIKDLTLTLHREYVKG